jgi:hypothetical protein
MEKISIDDSDFDIRIGSIAAQYIPDWILSDRSNDAANSNFMYGQLEWTDNLDEEFNNSKRSIDKTENEDFKMVSPETYDNYMGFNDDLQKFTEEMDDQTKEIDLQNDEVAAASKMLNYLVSIEGIYSPDPNYFEYLQPDISNMMRTILIDWMMEVWNEFTLKRETFHYSLNYVDRFLSAHKNVRKEELQLVGVTAMFMAAKMEEVYSPRVADFAKSTDNGYEVHQIVAMEKLMLKELQWRTTPPTYAMWANWYMNQWDIYISANEYAKTHDVIQNVPDLTFKTSNESAYSRFREIMQIMDLMVLDHSWLLYKPRGLIASIMYLILGIHVGEFDVQKIWNEFVYTSDAFLDPNSLYNQLFIDFIFLSFGFQLYDLAPTIQYVSSFMSIPFNYDMPMYAQNNNALEGHFEEFLSYQTHHPQALEFVKQRIMNSEAY